MSWSDVGKLLSVDNPVAKGLMVAGGTLAVIFSTTTFATVGVVGAAGWALIRTVFWSTFTYDSLMRLRGWYINLPAERRERFDNEMEVLERAHKAGCLSDDEFKRKVRDLLKKYRFSS